MNAKVSINLFNAFRYFAQFTCALTACLHVHKRSSLFVWWAGYYPANQRNLKSFLNALIGWKKAGHPKKPLCFWTCKQAVLVLNYYIIFRLYSSYILFRIVAKNIKGVARGRPSHPIEMLFQIFRLNFI